MKLDVTSFRYITKEEFRVLTAVEMGMRNHELVPVPLIESIAKVTRGSTYKIMSNLCRNKLLAHDGKSYDGYRLTYHGYDYLAIRALGLRGSIQAVGRRLGVGKESDVHYCQAANGDVLALKLHRLGRISFRAIKTKRDYLQHRQSASWMYMAKLAAAKEFAYMKALYDEGFPVPTPIDLNRHCVLMSLLVASPLFHIRSLNRPNTLLERLMRLIVRLARAGIVHGDFNEFNLMIDADEKVTLIDFPQIVHLTHANAEEFFNRDVQSIRDFFRKRLDIEVEKWPIFDEVMAECGLGGDDGEKVAQINPTIEGMQKGDDDMLTKAHEQSRLAGPEDPEARESDSDGDDSEGDDEDGAAVRDPADAAAAADESKEGFQKLLPAGHDRDDEDILGENEAAADPYGAAASAAAGDAAAADRPAGDGEGDGSDDDESEASDGPGQVTISTGKRVRKKQTAKDARKNLQKQEQKRHSKPNQQKNKETRKARADIKEHLYG